MLWLALVLLLATLVAGEHPEAVAHRNALRRRLQANPTDIVKVIVGYKNPSGLQFVSDNALGVRPGHGLRNLSLVAAEVTYDEFAALEASEDIRFIEEDYRIQPWGRGEITPYGLSMIQANASVWSDEQSADDTTRVSCRDPFALRVAIIDSGVQASHPDIACWGSIDDPDTNCIGTGFDLQSDETWYEPTDVHGTHVMGTIGALGNNALGVKGVMADYGVCYLIARVFGRNVDVALSTILEAVEWAVDNGAKIINLSLGGGLFSTASEQAYRTWRDQGVLVIAAAGNDGESGVTVVGYPASYDAVLSVAAVDETRARAAFSNFNEYVDVAAPGAGVLSTAPMGVGAIAVLAGDGVAFSGNFMELSPVPDASDNVTGVLVECPDFGADVCPTAEDGSPHICVIQRGVVYFEEKAQNCQASGAVAAVIYNNLPGVIAGTLADNTTVTIPVLALSQLDGQDLIQKHLGVSMSIDSQDGYAYLDGTSMASPHVAGGAGLLWRKCPDCRNTHIAQCLQKTAIDLGDKGKDEDFGYGLIQLEDAYQCLIDTVGCCEPEPTASPTTSPAPTTTPSPVVDPPLAPSPVPIITSVIPSLLRGSDYPSTVPLLTSNPTVIISEGPMAITGENRVSATAYGKNADNGLGANMGVSSSTNGLSESASTPSGVLRLSLAYAFAALCLSVLLIAR